jgi:hypothetical protein
MIAIVVVRENRYRNDNCGSGRAAYPDAARLYAGRFGR